MQERLQSYRGADARAVITLLGPQLRGGECRPYNSDLRVRTPTGLTTYPDVTVTYDPPNMFGAILWFMTIRGSLSPSDAAAAF
jgi:hypothetical protein